MELKVNQELLEAVKALRKATQVVAKLIESDNEMEDFVSTSKAIKILNLDSNKPLINRVKNGTFKHGVHYRKVGYRNLQFNIRKCQEFFAIAPEKREWRYFKEDGAIGLLTRFTAISKACFCCASVIQR